MLYLGFIGTGCVLRELCYKETILQRMVVFDNSFGKFQVKNICGSHNMTVLYTNPFYSEVCYKGNYTVYFACEFCHVRATSWENLLTTYAKKGADQPVHQCRSAWEPSPW